MFYHIWEVFDHYFFCPSYLFSSAGPTIMCMLLCWAVSHGSLKKLCLPLFILFSLWFSDRIWRIFKLTDSFFCLLFGFSNEFFISVILFSYKTSILITLKILFLWLFSTLVRHHPPGFLYFLSMVSFCSLSIFTIIDLSSLSSKPKSQALSMTISINFLFFSSELHFLFPLHAS